jgi:hypothetical protein
MTNKNYDPWELLRDLCSRFEYIDALMEEVECVSDCPPEWPRCAICRINLRVGLLLRQTKEAVEKHDKEYADAKLD